MEPLPGTILLGKYRVDSVLGTGGMGCVVRASHLYLQQAVAIKILLPEMTESPSTVERFLREAQSTVRLKSEHIARVIDVGTMPDHTPFMVMEYLEGNDLNQILRHHGPQTSSIVCDLMLQACEGLAEAHSLGIVHRDIKPSNFFITQRPDGSMLLKILDFGISKAPVGYNDLTGVQTILGTPSYMSPEQMKSGKNTDPRSDIWSMGVVMYQLLDGRPPFVGESFAELVLKVGVEPPAPIHVPLPAGLGEVILRCMDKDPAQRQQDVGELARMLAPFATDPGSAAQAAARTTRILTQKNPGVAGPRYGQQAMPLAMGGGLATPIPISPVQLTPRSWPTHGTSQQGHGQVTSKPSGNRGWLIAGIAGLVVLAGAGGFLASQMSKDRRDGTHVQAPPAAAAAPSPAPPPVSSPPPVPPVPAPAPEAAPVPTSVPTPAVSPGPVPAVPTQTGAPPSKVVRTKPKPDAKPRPIKKPKNDLFDSRN